MPVVAHQQDQDLAVWHEWVQGRKQSDLAEQYGVTQQAISQALRRARALLPVEDRSLYLVRALARLEQVHATFQPMMLEGDKGAARIVLMAQAQEGRYLGLDSPAKLELFAAEREVQHETIDVKAELAALMTRIRNGQHD
jgi:hypothetical protein